MAYMLADTRPRVGSRLYHDTDPFRASQLSGLDLGRILFKRAAGRLAGIGLGQGAEEIGGVSDVLVEAVGELESAGYLTQDQSAAILSGQSTFEDFGLADPTDQASWGDLLGLLQETNSQLIELEQELRDAVQALPPGTTTPALADIGQQLIAERQQYSDLATEFTRYYSLVIGEAPPGLSGLGVIQVIVWIAGAAVFLIAAFFALNSILDKIQKIDVAAAQKQEADTNAALQQQAAAARAKGDLAAARSLEAALAQRGSATAPTPEKPQDFLSWVQTNAKWIGLGIAGLIVARPLAEGIFGGGRRR